MYFPPQRRHIYATVCRVLNAEVFNWTLPAAPEHRIKTLTCRRCEPSGRSFPSRPIVRVSRRTMTKMNFVRSQLNGQEHPPKPCRPTSSSESDE